MLLYVSYIIEVSKSPFGLIVELNDGTFGITTNCLKLGEQWRLPDSNNAGRYRSHAQAAIAATNFFKRKEKETK